MSSSADLRHPTPDWWEYHPDLYVKRINLENDLVTWSEDAGPLHPIRSLVGPPGVGKSWLLAQIRNLITSRRVFDAQPRIVLSLDARQILDASKHDEIKHLLIDQANASCPDLNFPQDDVPTLPAVIAGVREQLCKRCSTAIPLVLIDGCDDLLSQEEFNQLQRRYLVPFFGAGTQCFRMIVARRRPLTEYHLRMRSSSIAVGVFENPQVAATEQTTRLYSHFLPDTRCPTDLMALLPEYCTYTWNHPFINSFLLEYTSIVVPVTSEILTKCCLWLINRPHASAENAVRHPLLPSSEFEELVQLAEFPDCWTGADFRVKFGRSLDAAHLQRGIIVNLPSADGSSSPFYTIADGLRELLRDLAEMRQKENKP